MNVKFRDCKNNVSIMNSSDCHNMTGAKKKKVFIKVFIKLTSNWT